MTVRYVSCLDAGQVAEALRQNHPFWGEGRTLDEHLAYNREQLGRAGPEMLRYVGLVEGDELVAAIKRYALLLGEDGGAPLRAVGIGAVFTKPERRRGGLAAELLRAVLGEAEDLGCGAAFLYSDIDPAYYARLGFVALDPSEHVARAVDLPSAAPLEIRAATDDDLDRLIAFHASAFAGSGLLRAVRTRASWRYFTWRNRVAGTHLLVDRGDVVGYLLAARDDPRRDLPDLAGDSLWLDEWSAPGIPRDRVLATVRAIAERGGLERVRAWLPPFQAGPPFEAHPRREAFPMIRPLGGTQIAPSQTFLSAFEHF